MEVAHAPLKISRKEVRRIDKDIGSLMSRGGLIRIREIKGQLASFKHDVLTN